MTEQELVQAALAGLPRPTPPPLLRRAVMARVRQEADGLQAQVWCRAAGENWAVEWRQGRILPEQEPKLDLIGPASATFTQWRHQEQHQEGNRVTLYQTTRTH